MTHAPLTAKPMTCVTDFLITLSTGPGHQVRVYADISGIDHDPDRIARGLTALATFRTLDTDPTHIYFGEVFGFDADDHIMTITTNDLEREGIILTHEGATDVRSDLVAA